MSAAGVEIFRRDGSRIKDLHSENATRTRRRKLPFMIEHLADDADGVQYIERLDESTTAEPIYMARYLDATGCELRVSHGQGWFLTDRVREALRERSADRFFRASISRWPSRAARCTTARSTSSSIEQVAPRLRWRSRTAADVGGAPSAPEHEAKGRQRGDADDDRRADQPQPPHAQRLDAPDQLAVLLGECLDQFRGRHHLLVQ